MQPKKLNAESNIQGFPDSPILNEVIVALPCFGLLPHYALAKIFMKHKGKGTKIHAP